MAKIHLVEGPVGAGKSTYAVSLASRIGGVHVALDEWFARLFSPDRPDTDFVRWYIARKERLIDLIWNHARALLEAGTNPVLELGLIQRQSREAFYERVRTADAELVVYVLDAPRDVRRERVRRRNLERGSTFFAVVPDHIFEMASDLWEPPDEDEIAENHIQLVSAPIGAVAGTR